LIIIVYRYGEANISVLLRNGAITARPPLDRRYNWRIGREFIRRLKQPMGGAPLGDLVIAGA